MGMSRLTRHRRRKRIVYAHGRGFVGRRASSRRSKGGRGGRGGEKDVASDERVRLSARAILVPRRCKVEK